MARNITRRDLFTKVAPAVAAVAVAPRSQALNSKAAFHHGVASGDPTQSQLIIWTRVTTSQKSLEVGWELSENSDFSSILAAGTRHTSNNCDHTVKIDVTGLQAGTTYYYRFNTLGVQSVVGRAITLPSGEIESFKMGICSCANYPAGYFNGYAALAENNELDLVLHLGDYIYEYDASGYASSSAEALGRISEPLKEITELADFRRRHAQYKSDKSLQALHAKVPFILSWDDHEIANDTWQGGAENHNEGEGDWSARKAAALQAYYEWMPIRAPQGRERVEQWRSFEIGELATLIMLETRLVARDQQVELGRDMVYRQIKFDVSGASNVIRADDSATGEHIISLDLPYDDSADEPIPIVDYDRIVALQAHQKLPEGISYKPDIPAFKNQVLNHPERRLLGNKQRDFVVNTLTESKKHNKPWQIIGNQTLIAKMDTPNFADRLTESEKENMAEWLQPALPLCRLGIPFGTDSWNGYGAEREWLLEQAARQDANMIVLTGDTHAAWGVDLAAESVTDWQGIELGATSISSPGLPEALGLEAKRLSRLLMETNTNLRYSETAHRGYLTLELTAQSAIAEFHRISTVTSKKYQSAGTDRFAIVKREEGRGIELKPI